MLKETVRHEGGRPKDKPSHGGSVLPDGISYNQSSRWQKIAEVPEEKLVTPEANAGGRNGAKPEGIGSIASGAGGL